MPSESKEEMIESYVGEYKKKGLLSTKYGVKLVVYKEHITGVGFNLYEDEVSLEPSAFNIDLIKIIKLTITSINNIEALRVDFGRTEFYSDASIIIPNIECAKAIEIVEKAKREAKRIVDEEEKRRKEENIVLQKKQLEESLFR